MRSKIRCRQCNQLGDEVGCLYTHGYCRACWRKRREWLAKTGRLNVAVEYEPGKYRIEKGEEVERANDMGSRQAGFSAMFPLG